MQYRIKNAAEQHERVPVKANYMRFRGAQRVAGSCLDAC
jgi:hypothetical protein